VADVLTDVEVRVLGALIEKAMATPQAYPLSLNALTNACNQTSNRDPVVHYDEETVARAIETLRARALVRAIPRSDSRVTKYQHLVPDTLGLDPHETAVLCALMLRGPQTVAEARTRASRLGDVGSLADVEATLERLAVREGTPLVARLPRRPGQKEARCAHLLSGEVSYDVPDAVARPLPADAERLAPVEEATEELRKEVADLRAQLETLRKQFESVGLTITGGDGDGIS
jgi:uncharacterized protein